MFRWNWGLVPTDGDVVPFSRLKAGSGGAGRKLRKHHYLSITYMAGFTGPDGRVWAYFDDKPDDPQPSQPGSIAYPKMTSRSEKRGNSGANGIGQWHGRQLLAGGKQV